MVSKHTGGATHEVFHHFANFVEYFVKFSLILLRQMNNNVSKTQSERYEFVRISVFVFIFSPDAHKRPVSIKNKGEKLSEPSELN